MLIDVAIWEDRNVVKKKEEKILKYKDLTTETERKCNNKTEVLLLTIAAKWKHLSTTQKIPEQHTGKARNQGT
jgi:hypothetical protein